MFSEVFKASIMGKAVSAGKIKVAARNIRDYATDIHHTVDDAPYGGGAGMVLKPDVLASALEGVPAASMSAAGMPETGKKRKVILLSPQGKKLTQSLAKELAGFDQLVLICGRYEGVDERFIELFVDNEISVGDYVTNGGEIPAMVLCDVVIRLIPGVLGKPKLLKERITKNGGFVEYAQYTRPEV
ncbi:MAG: tRNA (guanosine(37)-N1)-methyltransferase TrmD, partial [Deltaproteobacteria bacterium]|nr:tRNA (guanosine(37)-N1)-methyltransferase TrmD [Deltaproteobacteria bacterium]